MKYNAADVEQLNLIELAKLIKMLIDDGETDIAAAIATISPYDSDEIDKAVADV